MKKNPVFGPFWAHFPNFWGKKSFPGKSGSVPTTSYGFLAPCQKLEKVNDTIQRKCLDRRKDRQKDGRTDPILWDPSSYHWGSNIYFEIFLTTEFSSVVFIFEIIFLKKWCARNREWAHIEPQNFIEEPKYWAQC